MNPSPIIIEPGMVLNGWYVEHLVMETSLAQLWKVRNTLPGLNQFAALKVIAERLMQNEEMMMRFVDEIRILTALRLEHVPPAIGYFPIAPRYAVLTRWIDGPTLADRIDQNPRGMDLAEIARISLPILRTLDQLHRLKDQLIHRDIKPLNVMIESTGKPFLIDFGIALVRGSVRLSRPGQIMGTPEYMAPEMIRRGGEISYSVDIYAYGMMLFEMLTGRPAFSSSSFDDTVRCTEIHRQHLDILPPLVSDFRMGVSDDIEYIVQKAIHKDPAQRWGSCGQMAAALAALVQGIDGSCENQGADMPLAPKLIKQSAPVKTPVPITPQPSTRPPSAVTSPPLARPPVSGAAVAIEPTHVVTGVSTIGTLLLTPGVALLAALPYVLERLQNLDAPFDPGHPMLLIAAGGLVVSFLAYLQVLYKGWKAIQDSETGVDPGGVLFQHALFPYTIVCVWRYFAGYGDHFNRYVERHQLDIPYISSALSHIYILSWFLLLFTLVIPGLGAKVLLIIGVYFALLVLFALMMARMCDAINDLYDIQTESPLAMEAPAR